MNDIVSVDIKGLDQLQAALEELPQKVAKRGIRQALRAGGVEIKDEMVLLAPKDSGFMSEHVDVKTRLMRDELAGTAYIGPNSKQVYPRNPKWPARTAALVARWLEYGTARMAKRPFMTQAFEVKKQSALEAIIAKLKAAVEN